MTLSRYPRDPETCLGLSVHRVPDDTAMMGRRCDGEPRPWVAQKERISREDDSRFFVQGYPMALGHDPSFDGEQTLSGASHHRRGEGVSTSAER